MKRATGFTLLELLVVLGITTIVSLAAARAYQESISYDQTLRSGREELQKTQAFEDRVSALLREAYMTGLADDTASCFIGQIGSGQVEGGLEAPNSLADNLTFTTFGGGVPARVIESKDDFETLNQNEGPQGGIAEMSLSTTPVGQPLEIKGLYLRTQRPADEDPTQGGTEEQLDPDVQKIEFEFFDGSTWQPVWDTRTMNPKRLPAAVRVTYRREGENQDRTFVVRLPHSDVTPENPVTEVTQ